MKLLMTADGVGGVWTYAVELARGLAEHGAEILIASSGGPLTDAQRKQFGSLPHVRLVETRFKLEWMEDPWDDVAGFGARLLELATEFQPDIVHLNEYSHAALDWRAPTLVVGHSCVFSWFENVRRQSPGSEWNRYRSAVTRGLQAAEAVVAPTRFMLDALERHYGPLATGRVIPNGFTSERGISKCVKEPFVFAAGRWWDEAKNVAALAQVAPRICWPIKIAGLPSPRSGHTDSPPGVENLGRLNAAEMHEQYRRASIYCLPARYEPFGLTPLEAASAGCALVLGELPSLQEVWGDAAIYVPPDDEAAIADALNRLVADEGRRNDLARRGQARALKYSRTRMAEGYMKLYRELQEERIEHVSRTMAGGLR